MIMWMRRRGGRVALPPASSLGNWSRGRVVGVGEALPAWSGTPSSPSVLPPLLAIVDGWPAALMESDGGRKRRNGAADDKMTATVEAGQATRRAEEGFRLELLWLGLGTTTS